MRKGLAAFFSAAILMVSMLAGIPVPAYAAAYSPNPAGEQRVSGRRGGLGFGGVRRCGRDGHARWVPVGQAIRFQGQATRGRAGQPGAAGRFVGGWRRADVLGVSGAGQDLRVHEKDVACSGALRDGGRGDGVVSLGEDQEAVGYQGGRHQE